MTNTVYSVPKIISLLTPVFEAYKIKKAVLFGSYGKGTATDSSDVDIMVESGLRGLKFVGLIEDIRESLNDKDVDLLDVSHIEKNSRVEEEIQKTGVSIYEE